MHECIGLTVQWKRKAVELRRGLLDFRVEWNKFLRAWGIWEKGFKVRIGIRNKRFLGFFGQKKTEGKVFKEARHSLA